MRLALELRIPEALPSWNQFYAGKHYRVRMRMKERWKGLVFMARVAPHLELIPFASPVIIEIVVYKKAHVLDCDNICGKLIIDAMKGWEIEDDSPECVEEVRQRSVKGKSDETVVRVYAQDD